MQRIIKNKRDLDGFVSLCESYKMPFTLSIQRGGVRSLEQNRLQQMWHNEAAEQLQDETAEDKRAYAKLHFGIPILRVESEEYREQYDRLIRPQSYEWKLAMMKAPIDYPVTRIMTTAQKTQFLDELQQYYRALGVQLTEPL